MSDIKLFHVANGSVTQLTGTSVAVEKSLQPLIETHSEEFLGVFRRRKGQALRKGLRASFAPGVSGKPFLLNPSP